MAQIKVCINFQLASNHYVIKGKNNIANKCSKMQKMLKFDLKNATLKM